MNRSPAPSRCGALLALSALAISLAACSSTSPPSGGAPSASRPDAGRAPATSAQRSGGFYLDDGPGANPPKDLDAIPDAVPRAEPLNPRTARPYVVFDRQYVPMTALAPYRERGVASWYGRRYHGQRTSNGEIYDMYGMTAAHPTLPLPSYARVTNLRNGRSVVVRVNDRGPFLDARLIDLSYTAAAKLGYVSAGSAEVEVELITRFDRDGEPLKAQGAAADGARVASAAAGVADPASTGGAGAARAAGGPSAGAATVASASVSLGAAPEKLELETVLSPAPTASAASAASAPGPASSTAAPTGDAGGLAAGSPQGPSSGSPQRASGAAPASAATGVYLQLGAFTSREAAESSRARIARDLEGVVDGVEVRREGSLFKLHAGPYAARADALAAAERIRQLTAVKPFAVIR